jgi:purine-binding chemotaxis protein CheW
MNNQTVAQQKPASTDGNFSDNELQLVSFSLAKEDFGIDILRVQEIIRTTLVTRVPNSPHFIEGVINLRGRVIPIIDLRRRFGMMEVEHDKNTRIIVVEVKNKIVGFVVDSVRQVLRIPNNVIEPPPPIVANISSDYIYGIAKLDDRLLILLDLERVLSNSELSSL